MAATFPAKGRAITVKRGAGPTLIAGVRTKSMSINGSPIDTTNDDDLGIRKLMDEPGELSMSITVAGVTKDAVLRAESVSSTDRVDATEFGFPGTVVQGKIAGNFFLASYSETGEYQGVSTFEATFESAGPLTYTPAS